MRLARFLEENSDLFEKGEFGSYEINYETLKSVEGKLNELDEFKQCDSFEICENIRGGFSTKIAQTNFKGDFKIRRIALTPEVIVPDAKNARAIIIYCHYPHPNGREEVAGNDWKQSYVYGIK